MMEKREIIRILRSLAAGIDPQTGEDIAPDSPYQHIKTIRALHLAAKELAAASGDDMESIEQEIASIIPRSITLPHPSLPPPTPILTPTLTISKNIAPANAGNTWTDQEIQDLVKAFDKGISMSELAKKHRRTQAAIRSRLMRTGRGV